MHTSQRIGFLWKNLFANEASLNFIKNYDAYFINLENFQQSQFHCLFHFLRISFSTNTKHLVIFFISKLNAIFWQKKFENWHLINEKNTIICFTLETVAIFCLCFGNSFCLVIIAKNKMENVDRNAYKEVNCINLKFGKET